MIPLISNEIRYFNVSRAEFDLFIEYPIEDNEYFYLFLMHAFAAGIIGIFPLLSLDSFTANFVQHVCGMLTILGYKLFLSFKLHFIF
jgi:hypothetical protein